MFDLLYDAWLREKENADLQKLPDNFYEKLAEFIGQIKRKGRMLNRNSVKAKLIQKEAAVAKRLTEELSALRLEKLVKRAMHSKLPSQQGMNLMEEKALSGLAPLLERFRLSLKASLRGKGAKPEEKKPPQKSIPLRFLKEVPAIVGANLKTYGPFCAEDVAALPIENARVLISHGMAVEVETT
jgi:DNA replication initiation complex subunit (GINS family)